MALLIPIASSRAEERVGLLSRLQAGEKQTIVTYGTSLTAGGAWVQQLQAALDEKFPRLATVINSGEGGMWSKWGVEHLEERVIQKRPDVVFIEFGMNDAYLDYNTTVDDCRRNLTYMIDRILRARPGCQIILMTMNPPTGEHLLKRPRFKEYYDVYREIAKHRELLLIDHDVNWEKLLKEDEKTFRKYVPDGIHPDALGCEKVITPQILLSLGMRS
jgi:lysophospholipase L1-like esterase